MKLKVSKGELIISKGLEMADDYLLGGVAATPLALIRVKIEEVSKKGIKKSAKLHFLKGCLHG